MKHHDGTELAAAARFATPADPRIGAVKTAATNEDAAGTHGALAVTQRGALWVTLGGLAGAFIGFVPVVLVMRFVWTPSSSAEGLVMIGAGVGLGALAGIALGARRFRAQLVIAPEVSYIGERGAQLDGSVVVFADVSALAVDKATRRFRAEVEHSWRLTWKLRDGREVAMGFAFNEWAAKRPGVDRDRRAFGEAVERAWALDSGQN